MTYEDCEKGRVSWLEFSVSVAKSPNSSQN